MGRNIYFGRDSRLIDEAKPIVGLPSVFGCCGHLAQEVLSTLGGCCTFDVGTDAGSRLEKSVNDDVMALFSQYPAQLDDRNGKLERSLADRVGGGLGNRWFVVTVGWDRIRVRLAGELHEPSWRDDIDGQSICLHEHPVITGNENVGLGFYRSVEDERVVRFQDASFESSRGFLCHFHVIQQHERSIQSRLRCPKLVAKDSFELIDDQLRDHDIVFFQGRPEEVSAEPPADDGADQDICVEKDLHESFLKTSSSV